VAAKRRTGVLRRIMTLPVRRGELVAGQIYGLVLLGAVQIAFFLLVGRFAFHVNLGANLPGVALVLLVFAWVAAALGVLVGSLLDAQDRIIGICVLASLMMAAIGGCWWPLEIAPEAMKTAALFVPSGWALEALHRLISFGSGLEAVVVPLLVLLGFGAAATFAAARFFRV
jgi:ABC-type multidrug transport system permease subunit